MRKTWVQLGILAGLLAWGLIGWMGATLASQGGSASEEAVKVQIEARNAVEQVSEALTRTLFAWDFLQRDDVEGSIMFAHQALNIIEGPDGEHYDPVYGGPRERVGDGVGALVHTERLLEDLPGIPHGNSYVIAAENGVLFLKWASGSALKALEKVEEDHDAAVQELRRTMAMLIAARGSREEVNNPSQGGGIRTILAWLEERK